MSTEIKNLTAVTNAALPIEKSVSEVKEKREALLQKIRSLPDTLKTNGSCFYIAADGSPENDGKTPEAPWDSLDTLNANADKLSEGDIVLLKRGDIFRGFIASERGIGYGAYGDGEKPRIYGSDYDHITDEWYLTDNGFWTTDAVFPADVGNIIFDGGRAVGVKKTELGDILSDFDYWCDHEDGNRIYISLPDNPRELFYSIEVAFNLWMFRIPPESCGVTLENICFAYCGGHGIRAWDADGITVRGCEFSFIGGCYLTGFRDGTVRYGNAIEFMSGCKNVLIENCFAYQIYDSGITHQGYGDYCAQNLIFKENLLEYCGMGSIEYWLGAESICKDVFYCDNIMRFSGYGFGGIQRPDKNMSAHIQSNGACLNEAENFIISNNIMELGTNDIVNIQSRMNTLPVLRGNTYIQTENAELGTYAEHKIESFTADSVNTVKELWGDTSATVLCE